MYVVKASRRDDLINQRNAYNQRVADANKKHDEEYRNFRNAQDASLAFIKNEVEENLAKFDMLDCVVNVTPNWKGKIAVEIRVNERNKFEDNVALVWSYDATLTMDGEVERASNSWSGLNATNATQMKSLRQTVDALDYLNSVDWARLLSSAEENLPKYEDYVTFDEPDPDNNRNFNNEIAEAAIEDYVGTRRLLYGKDGYSYIINRETPKYYDVYKINNYYLNIKDNSVSEATLNQLTDYNQKVKKSEVMKSVVDNDGNVTEIDII